jgi:methyltransferase (TIGR00027 family)
MSSPFENVSDTARWMAMHRAQESARPDAYFHDPYALLLAGRRGEEIYQRLRISRFNAWPVIVRTQVFDEIILSLVRGKVDTVLNLGAGLDTRPYRLPLPPTLRWIDCDLPPILTYKERKLARFKPRCVVETRKIDLSDEGLRRELFSEVNAGSRRVLVITEGLLIYLRGDQVSSLAADLRAQDKFEWWLTDLVSPSLIYFLRKLWGRELAAADASMKFAPREGVAFFERFGWSVIDLRFLTDEAQRLRREMKTAWLWRHVTRLPPLEKTYRNLAVFTLLKQS